MSYVINANGEIRMSPKMTVINSPPLHKTWNMLLTPDGFTPYPPVHEPWWNVGRSTIFVCFVTVNFDLRVILSSPYLDIFIISCHHQEIPVG